jgi:hypothetical protein
MTILYAEHLTLVLRELWQELENLISCMGKLGIWEMQYPFGIHFYSARPYYLYVVTSLTNDMLSVSSKL